MPQVLGKKEGKGRYTSATGKCTICPPIFVVICPPELLRIVGRADTPVRIDTQRHDPQRRLRAGNLPAVGRSCGPSILMLTRR